MRTVRGRWGPRYFPPGTGQTELQARAAADLGCTAYAGTPDYLKAILDKADEMGLSLKITRRLWGAGRCFRLCGRNMPIGASPVCNAMPRPIWAISPMKARPKEGLIVDEGV